MKLSIHFLQLKRIFQSLGRWVTLFLHSVNSNHSCLLQLTIVATGSFHVKLKILRGLSAHAIKCSCRKWGIIAADDSSESGDLLLEGSTSHGLPRIVHLDPAKLLSTSRLGFWLLPLIISKIQVSESVRIVDVGWRLGDKIEGISPNEIKEWLPGKWVQRSWQGLYVDSRLDSKGFPAPPIPSPASQEKEILPFFSVNIPVHNRREYLARTLASFVHQNYPRSRYEIIVCNHDSTDGVEEELARFDPLLPLRVVHCKRDGWNLGSARNRALEASQGELILTLDCDTLADPGLLRAHAAHLVQSPLCVTIGGRKNVDASRATAEHLIHSPELMNRMPAILDDTRVGFTSSLYFSLDEKVERSKRWGMGRHYPEMFRRFGTANSGFHKSLAMEVGGFCESFRHYGGIDTEFAYRMWLRGADFMTVPGARGLHQNHPFDPGDGKSRSEHRASNDEMLADRISCAGYRPEVSSRGWSMPTIAVGEVAGVGLEWAFLERQSFQDWKAGDPIDLRQWVSWLKDQPGEMALWMAVGCTDWQIDELQEAVRLLRRTFTGGLVWEGRAVLIHRNRFIRMTQEIGFPVQNRLEDFIQCYASAAGFLKMPDLRNWWDFRIAEEESDQFKLSQQSAPFSKT